MTQFDPPWNPEFYRVSGLLSDLGRIFGARLGADPPDLDTLQGWLGPSLTTRSGHPIRLIRQSESIPAQAYENSIFETGRLPVVDGWHDLFNVLAWALFPNTKAALNHAHVLDLSLEPEGPRSRRRDALTLFDECGMIVASSDPEHETLHRDHRWHDWFVGHRRDWGRTLRPFTVGHGLCQQALRPYPGLTGKAVHVEVEAAFFQMDLVDQCRQVDAAMARRVATDLATPRALRPLPVMGIPGWHPDNEDPGFYDDIGVFRPPPSRA